MLTQFRQAMKVTLALLIAVGLMSGCGNLDHSPMVSNDAQTEPTLDQAPSYFVFSPKAFRAGKHVKADKDGKATLKKEKKIRKRRGATIEIKFDYDQARKKDVIRIQKAKLRVFPYSLSKDETISMEVQSGNTLADIVVAFTPAGLKFKFDAWLELELEGGDLTPGVTKGYHIEGDGTVTEIDIHLMPRGRDKWKLWMKVPGFSRYATDSGDI